MVPDGTIWVGGSALSCWRDDKCLWTLDPKYSGVVALSFNAGLLWVATSNKKLLLVKDFEVIGEVNYTTFLSTTVLCATSNDYCFSSGDECGIKKWKWNGFSISRR